MRHEHIVYPAKEVVALPDWMLQVTFENGGVKLYDAKCLLGDEPIGENGTDYRKLRDEDLFRNVWLEEGGYFIDWGDGEVGINISDIWHQGKTIKPPTSCECWDELENEYCDVNAEAWILSEILGKRVPDLPCIQHPAWTCQMIEWHGNCPERQKHKDGQPTHSHLNCWRFYADAKRKMKV